jgi:hypothetical protein
MSSCRYRHNDRAAGRAHEGGIPAQPADSVTRELPRSAGARTSRELWAGVCHGRTAIAARRRPVSWIAAAVLLGADLFLHMPITNICDVWVVRYGWTTYNHWVFVVIVSTSIAAALVPLARQYRRWSHPSAIAALLMLSAMTYGAYTLLMIANIELIHFPQYALMTGVLLLGGNPASVSWVTAVAAGVADEAYQYLVIYAGRPDTYLDFNDMVLNAIGVTWMVLLIAAGTRPPTTAPTDRLRSWPAAVFLVAALLLLLWLDPPTFSPFWRRAATGRDYRVLSGAEGLLVALLLWGVARLGIGRGPG